MRRKKHNEENHERWLVSYADFITLLFAFFVVMYSSSTVNQEKLQQFAHSFQYTLANPAGLRAGGSSPAAQGQPATPLAVMADQLEADLLPEIDSGQIEIRLEERGIVLSLRESGFFPAGGAALQAESRPVLARIAAALGRIPGDIRLEGHTDETPIRTARFPSNWHLSTARALAVLKMLSHDFGIPPGRLGAVGYADKRPLAPNDSPQNRAINRRVDIVILTPDAGQTASLKDGAAPSSAGRAAEQLPGS